MRKLRTVIIAIGLIWLVAYALYTGLVQDVLDPFTPPTEVKPRP